MEFQFNRRRTAQWGVIAEEEPQLKRICPNDKDTDVNVAPTPMEVEHVQQPPVQPQAQQVQPAQQTQPDAQQFYISAPIQYCSNGSGSGCRYVFF